MPIRIIIADDFSLLCEDLRDTLSAQPDMEVVGMAESGKQAVAIARAVPFDIILMDIEMESIKAGIEAAEQIILEIPDAKIIFLTAHETDEMVVTSMGAGAMDYVVKGGDEETLLAHIRGVYQGNPMLESRIQKIMMREYSRLRRSEQSLLYFIEKVSHLTPTERALVRCLLDGYKVREIAQERCVEMVTVKTQIKGLLRKFNCSRTREIVEIIQELGVEKLF